MAYIESTSVKAFMTIFPLYKIDKKAEDKTDKKTKQKETNKNNKKEEKK